MNLEGFSVFSILLVLRISKFDELVKSRNSIEFVIPAKAGIQLFRDVLDPGFRRGDAPKAAGAMVSIVGASCGRP